MKKSKAKATRNNKQTVNIAVQRGNRAKKTSSHEMHVRGLHPYPDRMAAYLAGDRSQMVSQAFADVVDAIGKRQIEVHLLSLQEKNALRGYDLRYQRSPDGVLLWVPSVQDKTDPCNTPDFAWLLEGAKEVLKNQSGAMTQGAATTQDSTCPSWLSDWAKVWASWGHRFASIRYDQALQAANAKNFPYPLKAAAIKILRLIPNLRAFLLEYLPQSGLTDVVRRAQGSDTPQWLLPEEMLDVAVHGRFDEFRDDFWDRCCLGFETTCKSGDRVIEINKIGSSRSHDAQSFLDFVAAKLNDHATSIKVFRNPFLPRTQNGTLLIPATQKNTVSGSGSSAWSEIHYKAPVARRVDKSCSWISRDYSHLRAWEPFAREYIQDVKGNVSVALEGMSIFFDRYLANAGKPGTPGESLDPECAKRPIADEFGSEALLLLGNKDRVPRTLDKLSDNKSKSPLRSIRDGFIPDILMKHCSLVDDAHVTLIPGYWNPFANIPLDDAPTATDYETVRNAMPYRWIRRLRIILVQGPHFCDWTWAQQAQQSERGHSADWFEVDESLIDRSDPDCVWRLRTTGSEGSTRTFYEMWSPVRWVSLVIKLNTALRTLQVRVLDSGESDELRFDLRQWAAQTYQGASEPWTTAQISTHASETAPGATGTPWVTNNISSKNRALYDSINAQNAVRKKGAKRDPHGWMNGVLRPKWVQDAEADHRQLITMLYFNTNKTADNTKEGAAKGFEVALPIHACPLPPDDAYWVRRGKQMPALERSFATTRQKQDWLDDLGENTHWWLAKLRDWQEKYNPIDRRIEWKELSETGLITEMTDEQYEMYRPVCFLFREPALRSKKHAGPAYPLSGNVVGSAWWSLLKELQDRLNEERPEGHPEYRLVFFDHGLVKTCIYDPHSIRVSIITALIVEGKVPVQYVQALVGHSRLVMTIYYTKINPLTMMREIAMGFTRASEAEVEAEMRFMQNATVEELRAQLAFNDPESALAALGASRQPGSRNLMMWMRKLGGICPVGGVTHNTEGSLTAGCFNGGPLISGTPNTKKAKYAFVEGGPGTCVNCRWFITNMRFIGELQAIAENALYRYHEFKDKTSLQEKKIESIKADYERMEIQQGALTHLVIHIS